MATPPLAESPSHAFADVIRATRWHFLGLCIYLATQAYTIPVLPIGPSWAIWPGLADFAVILLGLIVLVRPLSRKIPVSKTNRQMMRILLGIYVLCFFSFLLFRFMRTIGGENFSGDSGFTFGIFQLYRLAQYFFLFWVAIRVPLNEFRRRILSCVTVFVLIMMGVGIMMTHYQVVTPDVFVSQLPDNLAISGPWNIYYTYTRYGLPAPFGMVSYNHSYTGIQVLLLSALYLHLRGARSSIFDIALLGFGNFTVFLSESRAGLASLLVFTSLYFIYRPRYIFLMMIGAITVSLAIVLGVIRNPLESLVSEETLARSATLLDATNADNLSDRDIIWGQRLDFLNADFTRWLFGSGFGNTVNSGSNAHMLALHLIVESGIWGLTIFILLALWVIRHLWAYDTHSRPIFWGSVALLFSSLTQETFYPVPSLSYFLGVYMLVLAITWRVNIDEVQSVPEASAAPAPLEATPLIARESFS